ncbi:hypothetical protein C450_20631 [Halococcus salifodinae DSM 8989]|uniref:Uncharacterized protein n=1 Tax=Halococcus salifodinae DSM 8989 TaxID=1227456 RepID=M0MQY2_9EURY|nr:hypothetical protein C450_20631 [Halococcus salifodinae DSM 8989]
MGFTTVVFHADRMVDQRDTAVSSAAGGRSVAVASRRPHLMMERETVAVGSRLGTTAATALRTARFGLRGRAVAALVCGRGYTAIVAGISGVTNDRFEALLSADFAIESVE